MSRSMTLAITILLICLAMLGYYRGWFTVSSSGPNVESEKVNVNLTIDPEKVKTDAESVKDKAAEITGQDPE